ncbi:hypothetical protein PUNSTDRAFT_47178 [Punctularia strigosozonata HHB-11173 SS5]|uniref:Uncharacterized protein n=1 Tax=Punctularia strigosozonata (strain HHB-11173) TaxID=741275 RepID=R7S3Y0_PUNST|nr:uncharacterized protein PUNSTDRAFT_47178 [Punctularia strigosozonata HHB-11173 SS5]EIN04918.1 hypothetical protein PUNSTDRAFT_47178 [Punctularia strigosozonata HHB-11173 SS5]
MTELREPFDINKTSKEWGSPEGKTQRVQTPSTICDKDKFTSACPLNLVYILNDNILLGKVFMVGSLETHLLAWMVYTRIVAAGLDFLDMAAILITAFEAHQALSRAMPAAMATSLGMTKPVASSQSWSFAASRWMAVPELSMAAAVGSLAIVEAQLSVDFHPGQVLLRAAPAAMAASLGMTEPVAASQSRSFAASRQTAVPESMAAAMGSLAVTRWPATLAVSRWMLQMQHESATAQLSHIKQSMFLVARMCNLELAERGLSSLLHNDFGLQCLALKLCAVMKCVYGTEYLLSMTHAQYLETFGIDQYIGHLYNTRQHGFFRVLQQRTDIANDSRLPRPCLVVAILLEGNEISPITFYYTHTTIYHASSLPMLLYVLQLEDGKCQKCAKFSQLTSTPEINAIEAWKQCKQCGCAYPHLQNTANIDNVGYTENDTMDAATSAASRAQVYQHQAFEHRLNWPQNPSIKNAMEINIRRAQQSQLRKEASIVILVKDFRVFRDLDKNKSTREENPSEDDDDGVVLILHTKPSRPTRSWKSHAQRPRTAWSSARSAPSSALDKSDHNNNPTSAQTTTTKRAHPTVARHGYLGTGSCKDVFLGLYHNHRMAVVQLKPVADSSFTSEFDNENDLKHELKLLALSSYFAALFKIRADQVNTIGPRPEDLDNDNRPLCHKTFLVMPLLDLDDKLWCERKFSGHNMPGNSKDFLGQCMDVFAHHVVLDSLGSCTLIDIPGFYTYYLMRMM